MGKETTQNKQQKQDRHQSQQQHWVKQHKPPPLIISSAAPDYVNMITLHVNISYRAAAIFSYYIKVIPFTTYSKTVIYPSSNNHKSDKYKNINVQ